MNAKEIGVDESTGRRLFTVELPDFESWPASLGIGAKNFALLVAADARAVADESLERAANLAVVDGASYVCTWGAECGRVEAAFDAIAAPRFAAGAPVLMTTAHSNESLANAIWFLLTLTHPDQAYATSTTASVAVVIGNPTWTAEVARAFIAPRAFAKTLVDGSS